MSGSRVGTGSKQSLRKGKTSRPLLDNDLILKAYSIVDYPRSATVNDVLAKLIKLAEDSMQEDFLIQTGRK